MMNRNTNPRKQTAYVQFSKKIVVGVTVCVTLLSLTGIVLCYAGGGLTQLEGVIQVYIQYAMVVFVAYSGNSAAEKWLMHKAGGSLTDEKTHDTDEEEVYG